MLSVSNLSIQFGKGFFLIMLIQPLIMVIVTESLGLMGQENQHS